MNGGSSITARWNFEDYREYINTKQWKQFNISDVSGAIHVMGITTYSRATYIRGATIPILSRLHRNLLQQLCMNICRP